VLETRAHQESVTAGATPIHSIGQFTDLIQPGLQALLRHPIYSSVNTVSSLRVFMESHVFAVWDFMTLLKTLQKHLTCTTTPWVSPGNMEAARFVNEIVLSEETDEVEPGVYSSHFDLYIKAMDEVGANTGPVKDFADELRAGKPANEILDGLRVPESARSFVATTLGICESEPHQVASVFLFGREEIIPEMFKQLLRQLERSADLKCPYFQLYLQRHIQLDEGTHAPMGRKLLDNLCNGSPARWQEAYKIACRAIEARSSLWDGVLHSIQNIQ